MTMEELGRRERERESSLEHRLSGSQNGSKGEQQGCPIICQHDIFLLINIVHREVEEETEAKRERMIVA